LLVWTVLPELNLAASELLVAIRTSRASVGCSCHNPSKDLRRATVKQLREALSLRGLDVAGGRLELLARVRAASKLDALCGWVEEGPHASGPPVQTCSCVAEGIPCHPQACGCAQSKCCKNPWGIEAFDAGCVAEARRLVLSRGGVVVGGEDGDGEDGGDDNGDPVGDSEA
jgi:hypothetical protein